MLWANFILGLSFIFFWGTVMYDNKLKQTKDKIEPQHTQLICKSEVANEHYTHYKNNFPAPGFLKQRKPLSRTRLLCIKLLIKFYNDDHLQEADVEYLLLLGQVCTRQKPSPLLNFFYHNG